MNQTTKLFNRIRLLFHKDKELYFRIEKILGFYPRHIDLYRTALTHRSCAVKNSRGKSINNERLEFLGDAVLESVVSDILYRHFPNKPEGFMTATRAKIVQRSTLNHLATQIGLSVLISQENSNKGHRNNIPGNAFEALIGAIYLDRGYCACVNFFSNRILGQHINLEKLSRQEENFKSRLLEWSQKNKVEVAFSLKSEEKADNTTILFRSQALVEGLVAGQGEGFSKRESQQKAAKAALVKLRRDPGFRTAVFSRKAKRLGSLDTVAEN
ncbi:MAG: ribonuclease III [Alloprevotella sp.]|nr:ribonuclease III [Alloprevotella sp.]